MHAAALSWLTASGKQRLSKESRAACWWQLRYTKKVPMQPIIKRTDDLLAGIRGAYERLTIDAKTNELATLETRLADPTLWSNPTQAEQVSKAAASLRQQTEPWVELKMGVSELIEMAKMGDDSLRNELEDQLSDYEKTFAELKKDLLFQGEYDDHNAILKLSAGAGGTDAQDWCAMLERMYLRWAEKTNFATELLERSSGEEAGIKSASYSVSGPYAYGKLRGEHGVHRLVRLSPFNADNLRQTSFALVEVLPEIDAPDDVVIDEKDLRIDVYRSGGHGGQSVNTTDSAVRITHLPTNTVVAIQNERSQLQNKETALKVLRSKLAQMKLEQHAEKLSDLQAGESASWGNQIRNYVLHPYTMVKDTRTKHEDRDAQGVLDGKLDEFMTAYLEQPE